MNNRLPDGVAAWCPKPGWGAALLAVLALFGIALLVRLPAHDNRPLWTDELWRANLVLDPQYWQLYLGGRGAGAAITSPLYALFMKAVSAFYVSPNTLRLSSFIPGVLAPIMAFAVIRKSGGSIALSFIAGLPFALDEIFVSYSNELKPYVFEVFVHLACLYVWLVMLAPSRPRAATWALCFLTLVLALLSTPNAIFILPAFGLSLFVQFLSRNDRKSAAVLVGVFASIAVLVAIQFLFFWRVGAGQNMISYWASGFRTGPQTYAVFFGQQLYAMWRAAFSTLLSVPSEAGVALVVFAACLIWVVYTGQAARAPVRNFLIFFASLMVTLGLVTYLQLWPLGALRPNLFLYGYMIIFLFLIVAQIPASSRVAWLFLICAVAFLSWHLRSPNSKLYYKSIEARLAQVGPSLEQSDGVVKDFSYDGPVGKIIQADCSKKKTTILADQNVAMAIVYYTQYDTGHRAEAASLTGNCVRFVQYGFAAADPKGTGALFARYLAGTSNAWFIYSHTSDSDLAALEKVASRSGKISDARAFNSAGYFNVVTDRALAQKK